MNTTLQRFAIGLAAGLVVGLLYGWVIQPAEYTDTTPASFRDDFRTDYVLMVATTYGEDSNLNQAVDWLGVLSPQSPQGIVLSALEYAVENDYASADLQLLNLLSVDLGPPSAGQETGTP